MTQETVVMFADVRLDIANEQVWRGRRALKLTPTAFALLQYLVEHAGHLVTKAELLQAVWAQMAVTEGVLTTHVRQIRQVLGDDPKAPRFIETVHRRGYRFLPTATTAPSQTLDPRRQTLDVPLVGREPELTNLYGWLDKALQGERQVVFVTGEAGIGKTALVETFLAGLGQGGMGNGDQETQKAKGKTHKPVLSPSAMLRINSVEGAKPLLSSPTPSTQPLAPNPWISWGQCIEHYGPGEPYLPILEALGRLCRAPDGRRLIDLLAQQAPTWLVHLPAVLTAPALEVLQRKTVGVTRERMLRELAEAVERLTAERPLVLWLEDLHWADVSTLDWLAFVARRREPARLLVIGAYRPVEAIVHQHPLTAIKHELHLHGQCRELPLRFLRKAEIEAYLAQRFGVRAMPETPLRRVTQLVHQRTDGNPLFMVNVVNEFIAQGGIVEKEGQWELTGRLTDVAAQVPESLRRMIEQHVERLTPKERLLLEVASVVGAEFSAAAVAAGMGATVEEVEEGCAELARREQFFQARGSSEWPDGMVAARYGFLHALYQDVLYDRLPAGRRQRLHQRIGEREEQAYSKQTREIATELAMHFERGREYRKAVHYLQFAGENAMRRSAHQEAINLLTKGLELLKTLPDSPERTQQEVRLQIALSTPLIATKGYASPEVEKVYARARELCQQLGESPQLFRVLQGQLTFYFNRGEFQTARELAEQLLARAQRVQDPALLMAAYGALGTTLFRLGELAPAREHLEKNLALYNPQEHNPFVSGFAHDGRIGNLSYAAWIWWLLGYPAQAFQRSHEALVLAQELSHPHSLAFALVAAARIHTLRQEGQTVKERAEALMALSTEHRFPFYMAVGTMQRGWALVAQGRTEEGIAQIHRGLAAFRATGAELGRPTHLAQLARAYGQRGQAEEGLSVLAEALVTAHKTGECWYEAELYRLYGELSLRSGETETGGTGDKKILSTSLFPRFSVSSPEECFLKAIEIARKQQAKSWELRATTSLARLWRQQGKKEQAHTILSAIYNWFTEGFDTKDLQEAKALLAKLEKSKSQRTGARGMKSKE